MSTTKITRGEFLRGGACLAAGSVLANVVTSDAPACQGTCPAQGRAEGSARSVGRMSIRPYQTLCVFCMLGETGSLPKKGRLAEIVEAIGKQPDLPLTLCCNVGDAYTYQDPGTADDTPEGRDFNRKRDFDILQRMNLPPGTTLPARVVLKLVLKRFATARDICGYEKATSDAWKGCSKAASGFYEKGRKQGIKALIPPRSKEEMAKEKEASIRALADAKEVAVRPHILLCAVSQYGGGTRPPFEPDNLPELLDVILHKNPDLVIKFARGADWAMCAPCPSRVPSLDSCVCGAIGSGGLYNELKDLNVLQALGLTYDDKLKAKDLYRLIFEKIPTVEGVCALSPDIPSDSPWRDGCGKTSPPCRNYGKGREALREGMTNVERQMTKK